ncbi:MAG: Rieske 2Fe-2S domain-containing protein, partial [Clostridiales bacterium]|nr:Rieske 2Fe-2S domain-containing protein [Clostridiales bacterium]
TFVSGFTRQHFTRCYAGMESVHRGEAKIVEVDGQKKGVYVDGGGHYHMVDAKCPHLGCQLEWNAAELSWDCPCHGSQFDFDGHVITNPANVPAVN